MCNSITILDIIKREGSYPHGQYIQSETSGPHNEPNSEISRIHLNDWALKNMKD